MKSFIILLTTVTFLAFTSSYLTAQTQTIPASPAQEAKGKIGDASLTIKYSSPGVKGRTIWGELVPYDVVWRSGANAATTITTDKDLIIDGKTLPAGTYSFSTIPREDKPWIAIFNKNTDTWGAFDYDEKEDALRVEVLPRKSEEMSERLTYTVADDAILLIWENVLLPIPVEVK